MPSAERPARSRRVRRPSEPVRSTSAAPSRLGARHAHASSRTIAPVAQGDRRGSEAAMLAVVGDDEDRRAVGVQLASSADDPGARARVEVARRLVGEHDRRPPEQCPRDRDPLALAARQLRRHVAEPVAEPDPVERRARPLPPLGGRRRPCTAARRRRSPARSSRRSGRTAGTRTRSGARAARPARARRARRRPRPATRTTPSDAPLERAHDVQQRRLARARRPDDRDQLAGPDGERHAAAGRRRRPGRSCARPPARGRRSSRGHHATGPRAGRRRPRRSRPRKPRLHADHPARSARDDLDREAAALAGEQRLDRHGEHVRAALDARSPRRPAPGRGRCRAQPCRAARSSPRSSGRPRPRPAAARRPCRRR